MPLTPQTEVITPNAILIPEIKITTKVLDGLLVTSVDVVLQGAVINTLTDEETGETTEQWNAVGVPTSVRVDDITALDEDIQPAAEAIGIAGYKLIESIGIINYIRKLI